MILFYLLIFIFGLCIGSFLNVLIYRLGGAEEAEDAPAWRKSIGGRSHCPECGHVLAWFDLIPLFSFLALRGQCRYCGAKISWQYPLVEAVTGILFAVIFWYSNNPSLSLPLIRGGLGWGEFSYYWLLAIGYWLFLASCLIAVFVSDLKYFIIPDEIIIAGVIGFLLFKLLDVLNLGHWNLFGIWNLGFGGWRPLLYSLSSAIGASVFFLAIVLITRGKGMGLGDVKLAFLMGLVLGWPNIMLALFSAFLIGALFGIALMILGKAKLKTELPFGTFLTVATLFALFFGGPIIDWYLRFLG